VALRSARRRVLDAPMPAPLADRTTLLEAELLRHGGNRAEARRLVAGISDPASWAAVRWRVRAALDDGTPVTDPPQSWPAPRGLREAVAQQVLRARCASAAGAQEQVMAELEHALTAAAPQRLRRPFLQAAPSIAGALRERVELGTGAAEFAVDVLDRLNGLAPAHTADGAHAVVVPLTEREGLMLRYLASTLSNVDISRALYISVNTVKTHQRMIYRKLAVNDRRDAVARGRALGLL
jgi:LuxR family maltose regulon positive regulatory protein